MSIHAHPRSLWISLFVAGAIFFILLLPGQAISGNFRISPSIIELDRSSKSGVVSVINDDSEPLSLQIKLFEWSQDHEGADKYVESTDLIYFPRIMTVAAGDERILRVGIKAPAVGRERTYRVFIEEIPQPRKIDSGNAAIVAVAIRFGVPIFIGPVKEDIRGEIVKMALADGKLDVALKNTGNTHFIIKSIHIKGTDAQGAEVFSRDINGWYLLSGVTRVYSTDLTDKCALTSRIDVEVKTSGASLAGNIDVKKELCNP